ncbi:RNA-directed DNA polymerase, eukaryota, reverse transcriptase zinc-binding domain protein, partial [Tanacetum coccineum]
IKLDEKSTGASNMTSEMDEFRSVTQISEVDDICSSVLVIPDGLPRKKKSFRFVNYVADKIDFLDVPLSSLGDIAIKKLSMEDAAKMIVKVIDVEIKSAIIIGSDICLAVNDFFKNVKILRELNATLISLVPKIDTPDKVSDFRPITCCNVLYKCISKILTNRINKGLIKIVSLNQSAFIHGRYIQDNIMITQELLNGYNRKQGAKRVAMKIDIQKAYDTISWDFLKSFLILAGFHDTMVNWIMTCISSASFLYVLMVRSVVTSRGIEG